MGDASKKVRDIADQARLEKYNEFRETVDPGRIGLALQAIRQRVDQDLMIAVAAYEIDCNLEDSNHRINHNPKSALPEIMAIKARLDVIDSLMAKYEDEYLELHPEIKEQMEAAAKAADTEDALAVEIVDPNEVGWDTVDDETPTEADPASSEE